MRVELEYWLDRACQAIAWRSPRRLVYWFGMRILAAATIERPAIDHEEVKLFAALGRWI